MTDKIITSHIYPPIPVRMFDWAAYRDGYEPECGLPYGTGATEDEAIADLLDQEAEDTEEPPR